MKEIQLEELKKIETDILKYIDEICLENNIKYFVFFGTLIGTVRHNGFIPWDDDVDIVLRREDYNKLLDILIKEKHPYYKLLDYKVQKDYFYPFAKLVDTRTIVDEKLFQPIKNYGVFIDIFPLDNFPMDEKIHKKNRKELLRCQKLAYWWAMNISNEPNRLKRFLKIILKKIMTIYGLERIMKRYHKVYDKCSKIESDYCSHNSYHMYKKKDLEKAIRHQFETIEVNIPENYHNILTGEFGDYMKLPPENEQVSNHNMKCYWKE